MKSYTVFAIDENGNHFSDEYVAIHREGAVECFYEEYEGCRLLFVVDGSPDFKTY